MKVFLSWSGVTSQEVAKIFKKWLPNVIQSISEEDIFVSSEDIDKGSNWNAKLVEELENGNFGILCITRENIIAPWIMFEAGALSKFSKDTRVCPFLLDLTKEDVTNGPLKQFQIVQFDKNDILGLLKSLNKKIDKPLENTKLENNFDKHYADFEKELKKINLSARTITSRLCVHPDKLECDRLKIEQELVNIKKSGIIKVFENQKRAVIDFIKDYERSDVKTIKILGFRGENFVKEGDENWSFIIPTNSYQETILGDSNDDNIIMNRYEAQKLPDETAEGFKKRFRNEMLHIQNILKDYPNNTIYLHNESELPFRMVFIDDYLFLNTFFSSSSWVFLYLHTQ